MSESKPVALWVVAHPDKSSFNRRLFDAGLAKLEETHTVVVSDLYRMGFNPVLTHVDLGPYAEENESFLDRWGRAYDANDLPDDVRNEQEKVLEADLIVLQFPLWWYSIPAILKGWFDRVFSRGFGFDIVDEATGHKLKYGAGRLTGKRAFIIVTAGVDADSIAPRGIAGDINSLLFSLTHGTLWYTGIAPLPLHVVTGADDLDANRIEKELERLILRIDDIPTAESMNYRSSASGDYRPGRSLRSDIHPGRSDLGIHLR